MLSRTASPQFHPRSTRLTEAVSSPSIDSSSLLLLPLFFDNLPRRAGYSPRTPLCTSHRLLYTPAPTTSKNPNGTANEMTNSSTGGTCSALKGRWMVMSVRENSRLCPPIWLSSSRRNLPAPHASARRTLRLLGKGSGRTKARRLTPNHPRSLVRPGRGSNGGGTPLLGIGGRVPCGGTRRGGLPGWRALLLVRRERGKMKEEMGGLMA